MSRGAIFVEEIAAQENEIHLLVFGYLQNLLERIQTVLAAKLRAEGEKREGEGEGEET